MALAVAEDRERFERLGDAAWLATEPTDNLLHWCLLWRWEASRNDPEHSRMDYSSGDWQLWELAIRPLVEQAWSVPSSDDIIPIAEEILALLGIDTQAEPPPLGWCVAHGQRHDAPDEPLDTAPAPDDGDLPAFPGTGSGAGNMAGPAPGEDDPAPVLLEIEGAARELARTLRPPSPNVRPVPHASRGELQVERAMVHSVRPFEHAHLAAPARSLALLMLVDESGSMGHGAVAGSRAWGAVRAAMLLDRACELATHPAPALGLRGHGRAACDPCLE